MSKKPFYISSFVVALAMIASGVAFASTRGSHANAPHAATVSLSSVNGTRLTVTDSRDNFITTVDTSKATITVDGTKKDVSGLKIGDTLVVVGAVNGDTVVAVRIIDSSGNSSDQKAITRGTISSISGNTIVLSGTWRNHSPISGESGAKASNTLTSLTVTADSTTRFSDSNVKKAAKIDDLKVGDVVVVVGGGTSGGPARMISIVPAPVPHVKSTTTASVY